MITTPHNKEDEVLLNPNIMKRENQWRIVNDDVMGGLSSSKVNFADDRIIFSGKISLKNNGGFASLRSPVKDYSFEGYSGIEIKILGDGIRYSISMKETSYFTGQFYTASFETMPDKWITVKLPFDQFKLYYFGKKVSSSPGISPNKIKEISFLIGDKQEGDFKAEIEYIRLY